MYRRDQIWLIILLVLIVIGIVSNPGPLIIPLIVVGIVVLLYFFPPNRWRYLFSRMKMNSGRPPYSKYRNNTNKSGHNSRRAKFRVIKGNKTDDSNDPPRYH